MIENSIVEILITYNRSSPISQNKPKKVMSLWHTLWHKKNANKTPCCHELTMVLRSIKPAWQIGKHQLHLPSFQCPLWERYTMKMCCQVKQVLWISVEVSSTTSCLENENFFKSLYVRIGLTVDKVDNQYVHTGMSHQIRN